MEVECSRTCRTCGEIRNNPVNVMYSIFQENAADPQPNELFASNHYFRDYLFSILKINIYDGMPQNVCTECYNVMNTIIKFYDQCEIAQEKLEKTFKFKVVLNSPKIEFFSVDKVETVMSDVDTEDLADKNWVDDDETVRFDEVDAAVEDDSESTETDSEDERENKRKKRNPSGTRKHSSSLNVTDDVNKAGKYVPDENEKVCPNPKCQHNADSKAELIEHIIVKHPSKKCLICKKKFVAVGACNKHQRDIHGRGPKHQCENCDIVFSKKSEIRDHLFTVHGVPKYVCKVCNEGFGDFDKYKYHTTSHKYGTFVCKYCGKSFAQPSSLRTHEKWHANIKPHLCSICGASFVYKCYLDNHALSHSSEKAFKCDICGKGFNYEKSYKCHKKTHMTNRPRPFICEQCGSNFGSAAALRAHMRTHLQEKPFKCELCDKAFAHKGNLTTHRLSTHGEEELQPNVQLRDIMAPPEECVRKSRKSLPFVCTVCKRGFKLAESLLKHFKVHSEMREFRCEQCPTAFKKKGHLSKHYNEVHLKLRPHPCQMCPKKFTSASLLTVHMRCHTGEKPFTCSICSTSFALKESLENHVITHNGVSDGECKCELCPAKFRTYQGLSAHNQLEHVENIKKKKPAVNQHYQEDDTSMSTA